MSVSAGAKVQRRTSGLSDKARKRIEITILSLPALIMFLGFVILPVFMAGYYGFFKWKGYGKPTVNGQFIGFENCKVILTDPNFQQALGHTLFVVVASLVIQGPLAILFALLLNQKFKGRALIRTLIFVYNSRISLRCFYLFITKHGHTFFCYLIFCGQQGI